VACAAIAGGRPSISAGPFGPRRPACPRATRSAAGRFGLWVALGTLGASGGAAPSAAASQVASGAPVLAQSGAIGAPEPVRPAITVPYDAAIAEYRAGRSAEALGLAERALQSDPRNPQLRFLRGVILTEQRRADEAIEVFRGLTEDFPELPEPYNNLAVIHAGRGAWDAARTALEQSIRAVPTYALAHENLGDIHLQLAAQSYEQAGRLDPSSESARGKLAMARELIGRVQAPAEPKTPRPSAQPQVNPR
jgi:tetratricopeptide (TPR) repeat protein